MPLNYHHLRYFWAVAHDGNLTRTAQRLNLSQSALSVQIKELEERLGRVRKAGDRWGPRVIDLDLLVYGLEEKSVPGLNLPHPGISERNFVLLPLCNIAPMLVVPGQGVVSELAKRTDASTLHRINA